jgi:arylsulfatase A-like enzyme/Flp pilus assembly protein TadD
VVTLDTVRADHLGAYGYEAGRTPNLDAFAADGTLFETAISVAPLTMPTHSSIMTGAYPMTHGVRANGTFVLDDTVVTLAEHVRSHGYDTGAVVSAMVLDSRFGVDQGFRIYDDDLSDGPAQKLFMFKEVPANISVDKAIALMTEELEEPWFLWVHLFDAHANYEPPPPFDVVFHDQPYDGEIAYLDREVGRLLDAAGEDTLVTVLADHGDSLGDHGEQTHGIYIYRSTTHIPWMMRGPGVLPQRVSGAVSQVDVAPTLTTLLGLPPLGPDGLSLARTVAKGSALPSREGVYVESVNPRLQFGWHELRALDAGTRKYIDAPRPELFDLTADASESNNLWAGFDPLTASLDRVVGDDDIATVIATPPDAATAQMLEALGYTADLGDSADSLPDPKDVAHRWVDLQRCQGLVRTEAYPAAETCLRELTSSDSQNITALASLAGVLRELGRHEDAYEVLQTALARIPDNVKLLMSAATSLQRMGRMDDAESTLRAASAVSSSDPDPPTQLGDMLQEAGRTEEALSAYGDALRRDDHHVSAYLGAANTFHRSGRSERALAYLDEAKQLEPSRHATWYNLGVVHDAMGHSSDAEAAYQEAAELDPSHAMTWNNLGSFYNVQGRKDDARRAFRKAIEVDGDLVEARYNLGTLLIADSPEQAIGQLRAVVTLQPDLVPAHHNLAVALVKLGRIDEALAEHDWVATNTGNPSALLAMARLQAERGQTTEARVLVRSAVERGGQALRTRVAEDPVLSAL